MDLKSPSFAKARPVLVPIDGSRFSERALSYAVELAGTLEARLIVLRATQVHPSFEAVVDPVDAKFDTMDVAEEELSSAIARMDRRGVAIEPHVYAGDPSEAIVEAAYLNDAQLIVMATHGRSGLGRWLYGSVADKVIRGSHTPVLLLPIACGDGWSADQMRRILVTLDGSPLAEEALGPAKLLARSLDAELQIVRVVAEKDGSSSRLATAVTYLESIAQQVKEDGGRVRILAVEGEPAPMIASLAREFDARLIVMATHGRSGLARHILGSVATEVLHRSTTPLLVVRPASITWHSLNRHAMDASDDADTKVTLSVTANEARLLVEAVELLLSTSEKEEHLASPLHRLVETISSAVETTVAL